MLWIEGIPTMTATAFNDTQSLTTGAAPIVALRRRTIDKILVGVGAIAAIVLAVAGGLLSWGSNFADDYVGRELRSQNVFFPDEAGLLEEGRTDLLKYAGTQVTTGGDAEAYASYIDHHLDGIADGATYADLGKVESAAKAAVTEAKANGASADEVAALQAEADSVTAQRNTLFKGETLRGLLLSTYAWSTVGNIAGIAAVVAYSAAALMVVLVVLGVVHLRRHPN
jgi:hypothetical protein